MTRLADDTAALATKFDRKSGVQILPRRLARVFAKYDRQRRVGVVVVPAAWAPAFGIVTQVDLGSVADRVVDVHAVGDELGARWRQRDLDVARNGQPADAVDHDLEVGFRLGGV